MAFMECHFFSEVLGLCCSINVILPQPTKGQIGIKTVSRTGKHPALWLLHGLSDDHTIWMRRTSVERYASAVGLAVVMPAVHRSFYADMVQGYRYFTYISRELPEIARSFFPLSDKREDNFVAGLSMGGFGAFKLALNNPERYCAAASLSGVLDLECQVNGSGKQTFDCPEFDLAYGKGADIRGTGDDLSYMLARNIEKKLPPVKLYVSCGTADFLSSGNVRFRDFARKLGSDLYYEEEAGAEHEWGLWDRQIEKVINWLPINT